MPSITGHEEGIGWDMQEGLLGWTRSQNARAFRVQAAVLLGLSAVERLLAVEDGHDL